MAAVEANAFATAKGRAAHRAAHGMTSLAHTQLSVDGAKPASQAIVAGLASVGCRAWALPRVGVAHVATIGRSQQVAITGCAAIRVVHLQIVKLGRTCVTSTTGHKCLAGALTSLHVARAIVGDTGWMAATGRAGIERLTRNTGRLKKERLASLAVLPSCVVLAVVAHTTVSLSQHSIEVTDGDDIVRARKR
jgi:hypothetical protein